ncbi:alkaline phosphatase [Flavobacterium sp. Fl-318]|uniref:Alkaline phosphatase n=1 Tax=Flavobacterium cupriresistens TaxID=2893885 RepID=A0ABU4RKI0_9FLAO|nr:MULTISPECIES: alkaline phosphatase [unclassified Flavobacterium]MDX6191965.1 alkaline phosphatase [Flavobacterium sp. Fl-318]UFH44605.1 alkaline phosphatase [Flavobacterium sp. F-323]
MDRRKFFKNGSLFTIGAVMMNPLEGSANVLDLEEVNKNKKAKNIILLVSDGMSTGTLNMADLFLSRKNGIGSNWLQLYKDNKVSRALMDTASASSIVTDSSAASSSWGGGFRVNNGVLNVSPTGEPHLPIWQKFKKGGKMAGCVTTVPITHATPAGFCVNSKSRNAQEDIAQQYLDLGFDIMMGGGANYFSPELRKDKKDMYAAFKAKGYQVVKTKSEMESASNSESVLGVFSDDGLPYYVDRNSDENLKKTIPSLAQMTQKAIDRMKNHKNGFVLQVESGKVDWAAHANDIAGLIHDQIEFDEAVKAAIDFAEKDKETLVIITTDHGNANPGIIYGKYANDNFDSIQKYTQTNEWILNQIKHDSTVSQVKEIIEKANGHSVADQEAKTVLGYYDGLHKEDGLYNYKKLPYRAFAEMQGKINSVGWISMDHSADYVELAMFGPGSELLKPFVKNTDLHYLMLQAAEVENKF